MNAKHTALPLLVAALGAATGCSSSNGDRATSSEQALSASQCATAKPWAEWVAYSVGQLVTDGGSTFECLQAHTSEPGWTPEAVPALWEPVQCATSGSSSGGSTGSSSGTAGSSSGGSGAG